MKYEPIYIPPPERPGFGDRFWLVLAIVAGIVMIAGLCLIAVEVNAAWECLYGWTAGHCS